ncbi:MAG: cytosine deaminase [Synechococcales cyanobacterium]
MVPAGSYWLIGGRVPGSLLPSPWANEWATRDGDDLITVHLHIREGHIAEVLTTLPIRNEDPWVECHGGLIWPCFVDCHTHLDKGHIWPRQGNPDGTFQSAIMAVDQDHRHWSEEDLYTRMQFALRCSYAHGTQAIRTHLDGDYADHRQSGWPGLTVFRHLQGEWASRIRLQAVSIVDFHSFLGPEGEFLADQLTTVNGVLGAVLYADAQVPAVLERMLDLAQERGMDLDLHCDETGDPASLTVRQVAEAVLRRDFRGRVVCGHCCSLSQLNPSTLAETLALIREARMGIISLPMCNLYLQDRVAGRTPRWRGITALHELATQGIPVAVASDNCRDPFYGYGDHDMAEVFRMAVRIGHLDRPYGAWPRTVTHTPAQLMGYPELGLIRPGIPADLVLFRGRNYSEWLSRSQHDRVVLRQGQAIDSTLPAYAELDALF